MFPWPKANHTGATLAGSSIFCIPSDTVDVPGGICNGVQVGTTGDVAFIDEHYNRSIHKNKPNDSMVPVRIRRMLSTGTTATNINCLY